MTFTHHKHHHHPHHRGTTADFQQIGIAAQMREHPEMLQEDKDILSRIVHSHERPAWENAAMVFRNPYNRKSKHYTFDQDVQDKLIEIASKYFCDVEEYDYLKRIARIPLYNHFEEVLREMETTSAAPNHRIFQAVFPDVKPHLENPHHFGRESERLASASRLSESERGRVRARGEMYANSLRHLEERSDSVKRRRGDSASPFGLNSGSSDRGSPSPPLSLGSSSASPIITPRPDSRLFNRLGASPPARLTGLLMHGPSPDGFQPF